MRGPWRPYSTPSPCRTIGQARVNKGGLMQNVVGMRRVRKLVPAVLLVAVQLMHPVQALAASAGDLDRSFGVGGVVVTGFTQRSYQYVSGNPIVLTDGRIVVAGSAGRAPRQPTDFAVVRYTVDGALDTTFGRRGFVHTNFGGSGSNDGLGQAQFQPDGKIVAAGRSDAGVYYDFALARYDGHGHLDSSFGSG